MTPIRSDPPGRPSCHDVIAGLSVALILIPQCMAYAELAGLPSQHGLYAAALPLIAAAFFASSPYLQTGPVALTSLLTLGALLPLAPRGTESYAAVAALLALVVGVARIGLGVLRMGWITHLMSRTVLIGFLSAAAILIAASQLPGALGSEALGSHVLGRAMWALTHRESWEATSVVLSVATVVVVLGAAKLHPLVPGVLIAAVGGLVFSAASSYQGPTVGPIAGGLPFVSLDLPWSRLPSLLVPGIVIAVVGFADAVSVARLYASEARQRWNANREFLGSGVANVVAGLVGGLPVGGALARTTVNKVAGARSRWSGFVTGAAVLVFLPFTSILGGLPRAVLAGIVIAAIANLVRPRELVALWRSSPSQAVIGWGAFVATLALEPRVDLAVVVGVVMSAAVHLWRESAPDVTARRDGDTLYVEPRGVLWFGSAPALEESLLSRLASEPDVKRVVIRCGGLGRVDLTGAYTLADMLEQARLTGLEMSLEDVPEHASRVLAAVGLQDAAPDRSPAPGTTSRSAS